MLHFSTPKLILLLSMFFLLLVAPVTAQIVPEPQLTLVKQHEKDFTFGGRHEYTLTVSNAGASATTAPIVVEDALPDGLTYVSMTGAGFDCGAVGQYVTCERISALGAGESVLLTLVVDVAVDAPASVTNEATVSGGGGSVPERPASDPTNILMSGLVVTKQVDRASARIGDLLQYTITVANHADTDAADVQVVDELSPSLTLISATPDEGSCSGTDVVACDVGLIPAGESLEVVIVVSATEATVVANEASAYARGFARVVSEPAVTSSIVAGPHVEIGKWAAGSGTLGSNITYFVQVTNFGPGAITGLVITDVMSSGLTLLDITPAPGMSCSLTVPPSIPDPGPITCSLDELAEGETAELVMTVRVRVAAPSFENEACLVHDDTGPDARPLCARVPVADPGFNPPEDSLPPPRNPVATSTRPPRESISTNPSATPVPQSTPVASVTPAAAPAPNNAGSQIQPPSTGSAGLR